ncbi:MAG TPA: helical backbone metal receptor [Ferruginibacter sp.]|nr:helical backbone metal receptor [Ferruginibacter sp.]HRE65001.1 helical backbone metal receptor [Ferruginibacter sp.]
MIFTEAKQYKGTAKRIISLVPSITELLHYFQLNNEVVGITKFCIHPNDWFRNKIRIGGTKNIDIQKIKNLHPDLIICNKEENVREQIAQLENKFEILLTDVNNLSEALSTISAIGNICNKTTESNSLIQSIENEFSKLPKVKHVLKTAYLIWKDPIMTIGGDTFINDILQRAGFENIFYNKQRYPSITLETLRQKKTELLLLSSEPYPFVEKHKTWFKQNLPNTNVVLVNGEMFSWYGSRLLHTAEYINGLHKLLNKY